MILGIVRQFIEKHQLLSHGDKVLVAISGGSDSVALLLILRQLGYECVAAHCNFMLRGTESDRDETFVRNLCASYSVRLYVTDFNTRKYADEHHLSIEMAARQLRYSWFERIMHECGAKAIAVAHHIDDNVETVLLNLIRGTGIDGLCGIHPHYGNIIRPLLCVSRNDIIDYLHSCEQSYVTDSTNLSDEYTRNKIRLKLLPLMEEINPSVKESIRRMSLYVSEAVHVYDKEIQEGKYRVIQNGNISIDALRIEPSPSALLFEILHPLGFNSTQISEIFDTMEGQSGKIYASNTYCVVRDRNRFLIRKKEEVLSGNEPPFELQYEKNLYTSNFIIPREQNRISLDFDKLKGKLFIRKWQEGDRFVPFGMKGMKLVSDFLTDLKIPVDEKKNQWLLCSGSMIVWVIGRRMDNRFRIDVSTKHILVVNIVKKEKIINSL